MNITADTNVLARAVLQDDPQQSRIAQQQLQQAELVAVTLPSLCELVWILHQGAGIAREDIAAVIRALCSSEKVAVNRPAVEAGLAMLDSGGDFADGVIAYEGRRLGGATFVSFDKKAAKLLLKQGEAVRLLEAAPAKDNSRPR